MENLPIAALHAETGAPILRPFHPEFFRGCVDPCQRRPRVEMDEAIGGVGRRHVKQEGIAEAEQGVARLALFQGFGIQKRIAARCKEMKRLLHSTANLSGEANAAAREKRKPETTKAAVPLDG